MANALLPTPVVESVESTTNVRDITTDTADVSTSAEETTATATVSRRTGKAVGGRPHRDPYHRMEINMRLDLHRAIVLYARTHNMTITRVVEDAVAMFLS